MDQRGPPEFILEAFADPSTVHDVVRGILQTIFFLRYFPTVLPQTRDVLGLELTYVPDAEIETLIDQRVAALVRQLESERHQSHIMNSPDIQVGYLMRLAATGVPPPSSSGGGRGQITVQFFEKRRRKTWYAIRGDDEVCWESWTVKVTVADPQTEVDRAKVRRASETTLRNTIINAVTLANTHKDHIPPIMNSESNPFPYQINVGGLSGSSSHHQPNETATGAGTGLGSVARTGVGAATGWATRMGIY